MDGVSFVDCVLTDLNFARADLRDVSLRDARCERLELKNAQVGQLKAQGGRLAALNLSHGRGGRIEVADAQVEELQILYSPIGSLVVSKCDTRGLELRETSIDTIRFTAGRLRNARFATTKVNELFLDDLAELLDLNMNKVEAKQLAIRRPQGQADFHVYQSSFGHIELSNGQFRGCMEDCTVGAGSTVTSAELISVFWDNSRLQGLTFDDVQFSRAIVARHTRFKDLKLNNVRYEPKLELVAEGAVFEGAERFDVPQTRGR